jgi:hypothetical protein
MLNANATFDENAKSIWDDTLGFGTELVKSYDELKQLTYCSDDNKYIIGIFITKTKYKYRVVDDVQTNKKINYPVIFIDTKKLSEDELYTQFNEFRFYKSSLNPNIIRAISKK